MGSHSDHRAVVLRLSTPASKLARFTHRSRPAAKRVKLDYGPLRQEISRAQDRTCIKTRAQDRSCIKTTLQKSLKFSASAETASELSQDFVTALNSAAEATLQPMAKVKWDANPWDEDETLQKLLAERGQLHVSRDRAA